jgi:hypothetical protein
LLDMVVCITFSFLRIDTNKVSNWSREVKPDKFVRNTMSAP